nr:hypothetical protein [Pimelobacter simplex]
MKEIFAPGLHASNSNGPVPTNALPSRSWSIVSRSMIGSMSSRSKMLLSGCANVSVIACSSDVSKPVIAAAVRCSCTVHAGSAQVLMLNSTSLLVNGRPEWNFTSSRSCRVSCLPSSESCHVVASDGCGSRLSRG